MNQMIFFSMFIHLFLIGLISVLPFFKPKEAAYTPVYTVNLISLPKTKKSPVKKRRLRQKPVKLLSKKKKSKALAKLKMLEKQVNKKNVKKKKDQLNEEDIPEMLAALDDIDKSESGLLEDHKDSKDTLLEDLTKLEKELSKENSDSYDDEKKSNSLEKIEELEKKWKEDTAKLQQYPEMDSSDINEALKKLIGTSTPLSNQNINATPSYLSVYFAIIQNSVRSKWENPSGTEILSEKETNKKTVISFSIIRSGHIEDNKIVESSGNRVLDNIAMKAVKSSTPLPPLPAKYNEQFLRVTVDFNYSLK